MPGKIIVPKTASIDIIASGVDISLDDVSLNDMHCEFIDKPDNVEHVLMFSAPIEKVYIENLDVTHLIVDNKLHFTTPIYKWLFSVIDTK